jgi:hypothetical protein
MIPFHCYNMRTGLSKIVFSSREKWQVFLLAKIGSRPSQKTLPATGPILVVHIFNHINVILSRRTGAKWVKGRGPGIGRRPPGCLQVEFGGNRSRNLISPKADGLKAAQAGMQCRVHLCNEHQRTTHTTRLCSQVTAASDPRVQSRSVSLQHQPSELRRSVCEGLQ